MKQIETDEDQGREVSIKVGYGYEGMHTEHMRTKVGWVRRYEVWYVP